MPQIIGFIVAVVDTAVQLTAEVINFINIGSRILQIGALTLVSTALAAHPKIPKPEDGRLPWRQATPSRQSGFGRYRASGPYMCYEVDASGNSVDIVALHAGQIDGFETWYLHEDPILIGEGHLGYNVVSGINEQVYCACNLDWRYGLASETAYSRSTTLLAAGVFGVGSPAIWPTTSVGDGIASLELISYAQDTDWFQRRYPNGLPQPSVVIRAQLVYDWRDTTQSLTNPATWKWSENPVVCLAAYLTYATGGMAFDFTGRIQPALSMWTAAANVCDQLVALAEGGTEKRYVIGGMYRHDNDPADVIQSILLSMDGWLGETGDGSFAVYAGQYSAPTLTIGSDHIVDYSLQLQVPDDEACNEMVIRYCSNQHRYTMVEGTPWTDATDQEARGRTVSKTVDYSWVTNYSQARRLAKREVSRANMPVRGVAVIDLYGLQALGQRYVTLDFSDELSSIGSIAVEVRKIGLDLARGAVEITWIKADPTIDEWNASAEEGLAPIVPVISKQQGAPVPSNVTAVAIYATNAAGGVEGVELQIAFDNVTRTDVAYRIDWRLSNVGGSPGPWISQAIAGNTINRALSRYTFATPFVQTDTSYDVQVSSVANKTVSDPSNPTVTVSTSESAIAPAPPTITSAVGGTGTATIVWTNPNSPNLAGEQVLRAPSGTPIAGATVLTPEQHGALGASVSFTDTTVTAGTWSYWVQALNSYGQASTAGPSTVTVT